MFPELVKRLILNSCQSVSNLRIPGHDDVWAPGFDGIVESQEQTPYVAAGKSVWEFGTNADSLSKINEDCQKRTNNPLGIDKSTTTFYLVIPRIWAYDNQGMSKPKWESEHQDEWLGVHIYDAFVLCDWLDSEPAVCAWLLEQFGEGKHLSFSTVTGGWTSFCNRTNPPLTSSMFLEERQDKVAEFKDKLAQKMCGVRADTFLDAYGFCFSALMHDPETCSRVIVVNSESTYLELVRFHKNKIFLLSFPFSGQVSDENNTIVCYSKKNPASSDKIVLPALWKSQFTKALCEMGLSNVQASECYSFTHGNLLSLIRRIPGNTANSRPGWADAPGVESLYPFVFLRQFSTGNDIEKHVLEMISAGTYSDLESKYESFLRMEDAPIKRVGDCYLVVNYEEAWMTLQIDAADAMSSRMHDTLIALLTECRDADEYSSQPKASIIQAYLLPLLYRDDIYEWLSSPELERLYWQDKELDKYSDRAYNSLMKFNPCGLLMLFVQEDKTPDSFNRLIEVARAIVDTNNYSNIGLLTHVVQEYDGLYYSEEWAELCLAMYDAGVFKASYDYYPSCISLYYFDHPDKMAEKYHADSTSFSDYRLPQVAYEDLNRFMEWSDYIYNAAKEAPLLTSKLGAVMSRFGLGKDGIFPHEHVRAALEKYSNDELTCSVAFEWEYSRGARFIQDGLSERKKSYSIENMHALWNWSIHKPQKYYQ